MIYEYLVIMADYNIANMSTPFPFILVLSYLPKEIYCFTKIYKYLHIKYSVIPQTWNFIITNIFLQKSISIYIFRYTSNLKFHYNWYFADDTKVLIQELLTLNTEFWCTCRNIVMNTMKSNLHVVLLAGLVLFTQLFYFFECVYHLSL